MVTKLRDITKIDVLKDTLQYYDQDAKVSQHSLVKEILSLDKFKDIMTDVVKVMVEEQSKRTDEVIAAFSKKYETRPMNMNSNRTCFNCGETGHMSRNCIRPRHERPISCFNCNQGGHVAKNCPSGQRLRLKYSGF